MHLQQCISSIIYVTPWFLFNSPIIIVCFYDNRLYCYRTHTLMQFRVLHTVYGRSLPAAHSSFTGMLGLARLLLHLATRTGSRCPSRTLVTTESSFWTGVIVPLGWCPASSFPHLQRCPIGCGVVRSEWTGTASLLGRVLNIPKLSMPFHLQRHSLFLYVRSHSMLVQRTPQPTRSGLRVFGLPPQHTNFLIILMCTETFPLVTV